MIKRPKFINLFILTPKMSITAKVSILHRISGLIMFLLIPVLIYCLEQSLHSATFYELSYNVLNNTITKIVYLILLAACIYHSISGVRFLLLDIHFGVSKGAARTSSWLVVVLSAVLIVISGVLLW